MDERMQEVSRLRQRLADLLGSAPGGDELARAMAVESFQARIPSNDSALYEKIQNRLAESAADILRPLMVDATNAVLLMPADNAHEARLKRRAADLLETASLQVLGED